MTTRREFLTGAAATAVALPVLAQSTHIPLLPVPQARPPIDPQIHGPRYLSLLTAINNGRGPGDVVVYRFSNGRLGPAPLLRLTVPPMGGYLWHTPKYGEILVVPQSTLRIFCPPYITARAEYAPY